MSAQQNTAKRKRQKWGTSKKHLNTPPSKQALAVGLSLTGKKRSAISRELGLDRETVTRILSQEENQLLLQGFRQAVLRIVPNALVGLSHLVNQLDRQAIIETLYGSRVLMHRQEVEAVHPPFEQDDSDLKVDFYGKYGRWPTDVELAKFAKTVPVKLLIHGKLE